MYYKVGQVILQSGAVFFYYRARQVVFQSKAGIAEWGNYYKVVEGNY